MAPFDFPTGQTVFLRGRIVNVGPTSPPTLTFVEEKHFALKKGMKVKDLKFVNEKVIGIHSVSPMLVYTLSVKVSNDNTMQIRNTNVEIPEELQLKYFDTIPSIPKSYFLYVLEHVHCHGNRLKNFRPIFNFKPPVENDILDPIESLESIKNHKIKTSATKHLLLGMFEYPIFHLLSPYFPIDWLFNLSSDASKMVKIRNMLLNRNTCWNALFPYHPNVLAHNIGTFFVQWHVFKDRVIPTILKPFKDTVEAERLNKVRKCERTPIPEIEHPGYEAWSFYYDMVAHMRSTGDTVVHMDYQRWIGIGEELEDLVVPLTNSANQDGKIKLQIMAFAVAESEISSFISDLDLPVKRVLISTVGQALVPLTIMESYVVSDRNLYIVPTLDSIETYASCYLNNSQYTPNIVSVKDIGSVDFSSEKLDTCILLSSHKMDVLDVANVIKNVKDEVGTFVLCGDLYENPYPKNLGATFEDLWGACKVLSCVETFDEPPIFNDIFTDHFWTVFKNPNAKTTAIIAKNGFSAGVQFLDETHFDEELRLLRHRSIVNLEIQKDMITQHKMPSHNRCIVVGPPCDNQFKQLVIRYQAALDQQSIYGSLTQFGDLFQEDYTQEVVTAIGFFDILKNQVVGGPVPSNSKMFLTNFGDNKWCMPDIQGYKNINIIQPNQWNNPLCDILIIWWPDENIENTKMFTREDIYTLFINAKTKVLVFGVGGISINGLSSRKKRQSGISLWLDSQFQD